MKISLPGAAVLALLSWPALVSDLEERGQQSCLVCHQGTRDQDFITDLQL